MELEQEKEKIDAEKREVDGMMSVIKKNNYEIENIKKEIEEGDY